MPLLPLTAWRLTVAGSALTGVLLAALQHDVWWTALSQLVSLAVGATYLALAALPHVTGRAEPRSGWLRGALTTAVLLVALAYLPMQNDNLTDPYSLFEHVLTPALVTLDHLLVARSPAPRRWHAPSWLLPPAAYLTWYVAGDLAVYDALDPRRTTAFVGSVTLLAVLTLAVALAVAAIVGRAQPPSPSAPTMSGSTRTMSTAPSTSKEIPVRIIRVIGTVPEP